MVALQYDIVDRSPPAVRLDGHLGIRNTLYCGEWQEEQQQREKEGIESSQVGLKRIGKPR